MTVSKKNELLKVTQHKPANIAPNMPADEMPRLARKPGPIRLPDQWREACSPQAPIERRFSDSRPGYELILDLAAEGGGVDVYGRSDSNGNWTFWCELDDWTPTLEDDDAIHRTTSDVRTWNGAIEILDEKFSYWTSLHLCYVHPNFRNSILELIENRQVVEQTVHRAKVK